MTRAHGRTVLLACLVPCFFSCGGPQLVVAAAPPSQARAEAPLVAGASLEPPPSPFVGRWVGVGEQNPPGAHGGTWDVVAEIRSTGPGPCGTVEYPSLGCGGEWICEPGFDGQVFRAHEQLTMPTECVDGGRMEMTIGPHDNLVWRWTAEGIDAWGTLSRSQ